MRNCHSIESLLTDLLAQSVFLRDLFKPLYRFNPRIFAHRQIGEKISVYFEENIILANEESIKV